MKKILYSLLSYSLLLTNIIYSMNDEFQLIDTTCESSTNAEPKKFVWTTKDEYLKQIEALVLELKEAAKNNEQLRQQCEELKQANQTQQQAHENKISQILAESSALKQTAVHPGTNSTEQEDSQLRNEINNLQAKLSDLSKENESLKLELQTKNDELSRNNAATVMVSAFQQNQVTNSSTPNPLIAFFAKHLPCLQPKNGSFKKLGEKSN